MPYIYIYISISIYIYIYISSGMGVTKAPFANFLRRLAVCDPLLMIANTELDVMRPAYALVRCPSAAGSHYNDVIMITMVYQITSLTVVYSTVYSDADQGKHQSSASLAFVWGIHRDRWIPHTKGQLRGKCFHFMTSSWFQFFMISVLIHSRSLLISIFVRNFSFTANIM